MPHSDVTCAVASLSSIRSTVWNPGDNRKANHMTQHTKPTLAELIGEDIDFAPRERILILNARLIEEVDMPRHIAFDVAVDRKIIGSSLEWLDDSRDLVREDCHLDINPDVVLMATNIIGSDYSDVYAAIVQHLGGAVSALKFPEHYPELYANSF